MKIEDERGLVWFVENGDPAYPFVKVLKAKGYTQIVLTSWLLYGIIAEHKMLNSEDFEGPALVRAIRLADCLAVIQEEAQSK